MKIWFDLTNSPHVSFFRQLIADLKDEGHEIIITSRPLSNTIPLLELYNIPFTVVGTHYGKSNIKKLLGFPIRIFQLYKFLKSNKPDFAIAQASYYLPVVARLLGIKSIYTNDNEHAKGNWPAFVCATKILLPEFLDKKIITDPFIRSKKISNYYGVKEGIYLWKDYLDFEYTINYSSPTIYIRLEPNLAQYYNAGLNFMDDLIIQLKEKYNVVIIPREHSQIVHYSQSKFEGVTVLSKPLPLSEIVKSCSLFIGAGGTMTREMAVIGIPTISVYQDKLLKVDEFLIESGVMSYNKKPNIEYIDNYLQSLKSKQRDLSFLEKGKRSYEYIKSLLTYNT